LKSLAIIGGTGVDQLEGLEVLRNHHMQTPFGGTSRAIQEGRLGDSDVFFLQRHGSPDAIPPHLINYRANLWALKSLGVDGVIAINAVGGITESMRPGRLLIPHQLIDYTWGREHTFDDGREGELMHIDFTEPYDSGLREELLAAAKRAEIPHETAGVQAHGTRWLRCGWHDRYARSVVGARTASSIRRCLHGGESRRWSWRFAADHSHDARNTPA
jgi:5'-methylthioinosine phosphorylase